MSKKNAAPVASRTPKPIGVADLPCTRELHYATNDAKKLTAVTPELLRALVAGGPLSDSNNLIDTVTTLVADRHFQMSAYKTAIDAVLDRYEATGQVLMVNDPRESSRTLALVDAVFEYGFAYSRGAYLLGVLVGREMGGAR